MRVNLPLFALILALAANSAKAEDDPYPLESADTSSPRATLTSFLEAMHGIYEVARAEGRSYESGTERAVEKDRAFRCLDLRELAPAVRRSLAKEAAVCLKETLDRIDLPAESEWPDADDVAGDEPVKWTIPHTEISIAKIKDGPREGEFLFSAETVERATEFYEIVKNRAYAERDTVTPDFYNIFVSEPGWMIPDSWIPSWARARWFGQTIWQWVGLALTLLLAFGAMLAIYLIGRWRARISHTNAARYLITLAFPITALFIPLAAGYFVVEQLQIYGNLVIALTFTMHLVFLIALVILVIGVSNRLAVLIIATPWIQPAGLDAQLVRLTCRVLGIVGAAIVLLEGGQWLGIPLTTLLAGAGVGGLALALAAQDSLKNVLGSMMITLDKPFQVGERIIVKGYDGVVEDIGLRSTKIRLLTGDQVSIPNEEMARVEIDNIGRRPYIRRAATIELPSNTPSPKVKRALEILRTILDGHEGMAEDLPPRVFLRDVNENSIGIVMFYWYHPPQYWQYLAFSERVTLQMSEQFEAEEIPFAAPRLTVHMAPDGRTQQEC